MSEILNKILYPMALCSEFREKCSYFRNDNGKFDVTNIFSGFFYLCRNNISETCNSSNSDIFYLKGPFTYFGNFMVN